MKVGEVWISKASIEEDEYTEAIRIVSYLEDDIWIINYGTIEDNVFVEDENPFDNGPAFMFGEEIFNDFVRSLEVFI